MGRTSYILLRICLKELIRCKRWKDKSWWRHYSECKIRRPKVRIVFVSASDSTILLTNIKFRVINFLISEQAQNTDCACWQVSKHRFCNPSRNSKIFYVAAKYLKRRRSVSVFCAFVGLYATHWPKKI